MIKIYTKYCNNYLKTLVVSGHANYASKGQDLVCAGVSCVVFGLLNALDETKNNIEIKENEISLEVMQYDDRHQHYFDLFIIQIKTIKENFDSYIEIIEIGRS